MGSVRKESRLWVYKCNRQPPGFAVASGDWNDLFGEKKQVHWGGSGSTTNNISLNILNKRMQVGNLVLAYQTDDRSLIGTCRVTKLRNDHPNREIWLMPVETFDTPIPILELKRQYPALRKVRAFHVGFPQTLYEVSPGERRILETVCQVHLLPNATEPVLSQRTRTGAGFGDPETNRIVEQAAVKTVCRWYRSKGWHVTSGEPDRCGYDLECKKLRTIEYVEVKGVAGSIPKFIITASELHQAQTNPSFVICVVTSARQKNALIRRLTGMQFTREFDFKPISFSATRKN